MSTIEKINNVMIGFSETQLEQILEIVNNIKKLMDDAEDDRICEQMLNDYLNDDDPDKHDTVSLEDFAAELGIDLNEI